MAATNGAYIKTEAEAGPQIKIEHDGASPSPYMEEDDIYEDAGDLDFATAGQPLWLTRLPAALWNSWSELADDEEIELGTVRIEGDIAEPKRVSLLLKDLPQFSKEPKEYHMRPPNRDPSSRNRSTNTYVFSEKDLPGFQRRQYGRGPQSEDEGETRGRSFLYEKYRREAKKRENRGKKFEPYARRPIPKQTSLSGTVAREFVLAPVENDEYKRIEEQKIRDSLALKKIDARDGFRNIKSATYLAPGTISRVDPKERARQQAARQAASKDNRAARMPQNELIDGLIALFSEYRFWGLREIKARIPQPEAYLRETLQLIAVMHRAGDAVGKWELKPEMKTSGAAGDHVKDEAAPKVEGDGGLSDIEQAQSGVGTPADLDDEDVVFENVTS